ncbi:MAG: nicotinate-nucleotide adenylyltransferase [Methylococcales bacterium]|nr:nicotinate-nucleotide adenylyltransferase [Methylococcales bacterium]MDD5753826.1 nicotinate-nucleotide adenylyltransferase [Methylococcales bacterium]
MIGIFGGTFDPIHYGHLRSALELKELFELDHIRLIPCAQPVHRDLPMATAMQRLEMLQLATQNQTDLIVDAQELQRTGGSYTFDTLTALRHNYPNVQLLLFIGSDAFNEFTTWFRWRELFNLAHVVVITRPNAELNNPLNRFFAAKLTDEKQLLKEHCFGHLFFQEITQLAISATAIRGMIAEHKSPRFLLPDAVVNYIFQHQLYF